MLHRTLRLRLLATSTALALAALGWAAVPTADAGTTTSGLRVAC